MFALLRVLIGCLFVVSGGEKVLSHYQNFLYVLQAYQAMPSGAEQIVARVFPWIEFLTGIFLVLGLWSEWALKAALVLFAGFITMVGQALIRHLSMDNCGCFGELFHFPLKFIIVMDSVLFLLSFWTLHHLAQAKQWSLDHYLDR